MIEVLAVLMIVIGWILVGVAAYKVLKEEE